MPYPATIDSVNLPTLPNSQGWVCGPFVVGINLYVIVQSGDAPGNKISCYKSTDAGLTWAEIDVANRPVFNVGGYLSSVKVGTDIFACCASITVGNNERIAKF